LGIGQGGGGQAPKAIDTNFRMMSLSQRVDTSLEIMNRRKTTKIIFWMTLMDRRITLMFNEIVI